MLLETAMGLRQRQINTRILTCRIKGSAIYKIRCYECLLIISLLVVVPS